MITRNTLRAIALATSCLTPLAAFAQNPAPAAPAGSTIGGTPFTGTIEFGLMGVGGTNPNQYGRYNGLNTSGLDVIGNFDLLGRDAWNSGGTRYFQIEGNNLIFQTGNRLGSGVPNGGNGWTSSVNNGLANDGRLDLKVGDQGTWGVDGYVDSITYTGNVIDSLYTVSGSQAFLNPGLLPYGGATSQTSPTPGATTNYTIPDLVATNAMLPVQVGTRRNIIGGNFKYHWGNWTFTGAFRHQHKEGSLEESYYGWKGGMAFALPVDYDTDRYDASAAFNSRLFQAVIQYTYAHFSDNNSYVTLPWPVANTSAPYQSASAYALPPSNSAHYVTIMLATNIVPKTRINLNARVGLEKQDDTFPPNTADPGLSASVLSSFGLNSLGQGTSGYSPDITATVYQVRVSANSNPFPRTSIDAYYGVNGRSVSLNQFGVNGSGHGGDNGALATPNYAFVVPQEWLKQYAGAELGYRILPKYNTRVTVGYRLDVTERSNAQVGHSWTNTGSFALSSNLGPNADGRISFDYASRSGSLSYLTPWANLEGADGATPTYSGAYYQAPMTSEAVTVRADYTPMNSLSGSFFLQFKNEDYDYPAALSYTAPDGTPAVAPLTGVGTGVKQDYALTVGPDVTYRPTDNLNIHIFYTFERLFFNNLGNGQCTTSNTGSCLGSAYYFQNKSTSDTHTVGISTDWKINPKLHVKADYTLSYGSVMFAQFDGVFVTTPTQSYQNVSNYPDYNSVMNSIRLIADYKVTPTTELVGMLGYSSLHNTSWYDNASSIQGAGSNSISILTAGYGAPNWSIVTAMAGVRFKF